MFEKGSTYKDTYNFAVHVNYNLFDSNEWLPAKNAKGTKLLQAIWVVEGNWSRAS